MDLFCQDILDNWNYSQPSKHPPLTAGKAATWLISWCEFNFSSVAHFGQASQLEKNANLLQLWLIFLAAIEYVLRHMVHDVIDTGG